MEPVQERETTGAWWEHFAHEADIGVRGCGHTLAEALAQAGLALCAVVIDPARIQPRQSLQISVESSDPEMLLVEWLDALIYPMATRGLLFSRFDITLDEHRLTATAWGEVVDRARHAPAVEVKGATFTALHVARDDTGLWTAQCVVDV